MTAVRVMLDRMKTRAAVLRESGRAGPYAETRPLSIEELELDAPGGHDAFLMDDARYHGALGAYFDNIER